MPPPGSQSRDLPLVPPAPHQFPRSQSLKQICARLTFAKQICAKVECAKPTFANDNNVKAKCAKAKLAKAEFAKAKGAIAKLGELFHLLSGVLTAVGAEGVAFQKCYKKIRRREATTRRTTYTRS